MDGYRGELATCAITQGTLLRYLLREGIAMSAALALLHRIMALPRHVFLAEEIPYDASVLAEVTGHRQVNDAYLAKLAWHSSVSLVTLDRGLAGLHPKTVRLIPT